MISSPQRARTLSEREVVDGGNGWRQWVAAFRAAKETRLPWEEDADVASARRLKETLPVQFGRFRSKKIANPHAYTKSAVIAGQPVCQCVCLSDPPLGMNRGSGETCRLGLRSRLRV